MGDNAPPPNDRLTLGIAAARAGRNIEAQRHFNAVLRRDPHNIPALFWLAFVTASPHDSIHLLERILSLDPGNERAEAGIRWAKTRLGRASTQNRSVVSPPPPQPTAVTKPAQPVTTPALSATLRPSPTTAPTVANHPQPRQPDPPRPLPRRRRWPKLALSFSLGALGVLAVVLSLMIILPPDTLAAWWPLPDQPLTPDTTTTLTDFTEMPDPAVNESTSLTSMADTILLRVAEVDAAEENGILPAQTDGQADQVTLPEPVISDHTVSNMSLAETYYASVDPKMLIGPDLPAIEVEPETAPAENLLLVHQPATPDEKWIEVNVTTQQITAWEGMTPVFSFTGSTGLPETPTVLGKYHIYWKLESTLMVGPDYYLPEVPYTMYFYAGYALHGAYWHDSFGQPMSHGCVNLDTGDAKRLFEWADPVIPPGQTQVVASAANPGTLVVVHK